MSLNPRMTIAGLREEGAVCPQCNIEVFSGDQVTTCPDCGNVHHWMCWTEEGGCSAYECAPDHRQVTTDSPRVLKISMDDLDQAKPLPRPRSVNGWTSAAPLGQGPAAGPLQWNYTAIASLVLAVLGIPLFGIPGFIAIIVACVALAMHSRHHRGALIAVFGLLLGVVDIAGWGVGLAWYLDTQQQHQTVTIDDFESEPDPASLEQLPAPIGRAMKSNVLIQTPGDIAHLRGAGIGSGVIVRIRDNVAWIVTNRHVVDAGFSEDRPGEPTLSSVQLSVKAIGQPNTAAQLVWIAPNGIDLALITMPVHSKEIMSAVWDTKPSLTVGESVFAVGNPHGMGWTYTRGDLSQLRQQYKGAQEIRILQTSAAINPGNSGGGLYDSQGHLLGINTWTKDKRFAEGLSFSIAFHTLLPLLPAKFQLPESQLENDVP